MENMLFGKEVYAPIVGDKAKPIGIFDVGCNKLDSKAISYIT